MLVTTLRCWWQFWPILQKMSPISKFWHQHSKIVTNIKSPTSTCHQYLCSHGPFKAIDFRPKVDGPESVRPKNYNLHHFGFWKIRISKFSQFHNSNDFEIIYKQQSVARSIASSCCINRLLLFICLFVNIFEQLFQNYFPNYLLSIEINYN